MRPRTCLPRRLQGPRATPYNTDAIGLYNPQDNTFIKGPNVGSSEGKKYAGGVLLPDGRVLLLPYNVGTVGLYNPQDNTFTKGPNVGSGTNPGVLLPDGRVLLVPSSADAIALYNPQDNTFTKGPNVGSGSGKYANGVLLPDGRVLLLPFNAGTVGLYDPQSTRPAYTLSQPLSPSWNVALLPYYNMF
eukprot:COSAG05_NODE_4751_length_1386_cov_2.381507_2_plen_188_part_00